ncbi:MAG: hypothetical protein QOJ59_5079 [Thermomicrobiales bacterium]|nr:hypothetical protein [Thermomicrobiales bacterium]
MSLNEQAFQVAADLARPILLENQAENDQRVQILRLCRLIHRRICQDGPAPILNLRKMSELRRCDEEKRGQILRLCRILYQRIDPLAPTPRLVLCKRKRKPSKVT